MQKNRYIFHSRNGISVHTAILVSMRAMPSLRENLIQTYHKYTKYTGSEPGNGDLNSRLFTDHLTRRTSKLSTAYSRLTTASSVRADTAATRLYTRDLEPIPLKYLPKGYVTYTYNPSLM